MIKTFPSKVRTIIEARTYNFVLIPSSTSDWLLEVSSFDNVMVVLFIFLSLKAKRLLVHELEIRFLLEANENNPFACFETDRLYLHASMVSLKFTKKLYKEIHVVCILLVPWEVLHVAKVLTNRHSANTFLTSGDYKKELKCRLKSHDIHFVPTLGAASRHLETFKDVCHSLILGKS